MFRAVSCSVLAQMKGSEWVNSLYLRVNRKAKNYESHFIHAYNVQELFGRTPTETLISRLNTQKEWSYSGIIQSSFEEIGSSNKVPAWVDLICSGLTKYKHCTS